MNLTSAQKKTVLAAFLGWMLDAFDFFLLVFLLGDIAKEFDVEVSDVAYAVFLTLAMRFVGAFMFGRLGDRFGRKPILMLDIVSYSVVGALAAFAPTLWVFLVLRALFGIAMGGEWGLGSSLAMESIPPQARGVVSGILQCGYPTGYLLASIAYGLLYQRSIGDFTIGWRAMFLLSVLPALVVLFIRSHVPESPAFAEAQKAPKPKPDRHFAGQLGRRALCGRADDVLQSVQPRHAGPLSDLPAKAASVRSYDRELDHDRRQSRRDRRRAVVRLRFGEDRPRQRDHHRLADRAAGDAALGLFVDAVPAGDRRLHHADQRAGRLGRHSRPSQRTVARARCARPCRASSIRPAISSPPTTGRSRPRSPKSTAAITASRWRWSPASSRWRSSSSSASARSGAARFMSVAH